MPYKDPEVRRQKSKEYSRKWALENPEKRKAHTKAWRMRNWDKQLAIAERYRNRHRARVRQSMKVTDSNRKSKNGGVCTIQKWQARLAFYGNKCAYCLCELENPQVDHVKPVSKGGLGWPSNLVPACRTCNNKKRARAWLPLKLIKFGAKPGVGQPIPGENS